jgi:cell division protein FtsB
MLLFVILFNLLVALVNFYLVLRLWQLRQGLARVTRTLTKVERRIDRIFYPAPEFVFQGQQGTQHLRQVYQKLEHQLEQLQKILMLVNLGRRIWQKRPRKTHLFRK